MRVAYSERVEKVPPYLFAEIERAIAKKKAEGVDVINLGIGDPDLPTPKNIIDSLHKASLDPANHGYPSYLGMAGFRKAVAEWYNKRFGVKLNPDNEVITLIGSKEGIAHIPLAFVNPNDVVLVPDPGYPVYSIGTLFSGGIPYSMPLLEENEFLPDLVSIPKSIIKKTKMMFINYPNAPTGAVATKEFFGEVVDFAVENNIIVCHDNPYSEMTFDGYVSPSFLEAKGAKDVGIEFNSLSKTYNMTGWRLGFASGNSEIIRGLGRIKENVDSGVFQAVQIAGIEALKGPQNEVEKNMEIFKERRDFMVAALNEVGLNVRKPKATFYLWFRIPKEYTSSIEFCRHILDECGVVFTPGVGFGRYGEGFARIALTQKIEKLKEAAKRLQNETKI